MLDAPNIIAQAEAGILGRGEQDFLVRLERELPGFGGLYIFGGEVRVHMKTGPTKPETVRSVLKAEYAAHRNPRVREVMAAAASASILPADYTLSELIAIQQRVAAEIAGWTVAGTDIMGNKVVVGFPDSVALAAGVARMSSAGIPTGAVTTMIMPRATFSAVYLNSHIRPTAAGLMITLQNATYEPPEQKKIGDIWVTYHYGMGCSLGFNVYVYPQNKNYAMTGAHCANVFRGNNGATGDTIFQPSRGNPPYSPSGIMGTVAYNPAWTQGAACPTDANGVPFDFCTDSDVLLTEYFSGVASTRKVTTTTTGGVNGYRGSDQINNFYPVNSVLSVEYVNRDLRHDAAKTGFTTGTTSGPIVSEMADLEIFIPCWPRTHYTCGPSKRLLLQKHAVVKTKVHGGDSGGPVFTGYPNNGAPYAALGIVSAGIGIPWDMTPNQRCTTCHFVFSRWEKIEARFGLGHLNPVTVF